MGGVRRRHRPFRFEAMWLKHAQYKEFLKGAWALEDDINNSLSSLQSALVSWNKSVFRLVEHKKHLITKQLEGIQGAPNYPRSPFLSSLEAEVHDELERLMDIEEIKWFQKSQSE
ncbi:hypothetical protein QN277_014612 [Acacia crassicarpa]|uniref:Uncharacterized protein n=1 Tax=Acacia crassicarpa TaxID=499986 RepID=A0AAE1JTB9_9FABA|nr:hypothetical protein QN277_014612 [Acacia crassicarpa]